MQGIAAIFPASYVFKGLRETVKGGTVAHSDLVIGAVIAVLYILAASWVFGSTYRRAVRTGLIARYSAENVT